MAASSVSMSGSSDLVSLPEASLTCYKDQVWPPGPGAFHLMPSVFLHGSVICPVLFSSSVVWGLKGW